MGRAWGRWMGLLLLAAVWAMLSRGAPGAWAAGAVALLLAGSLQARLRQAGALRLRWTRLPRFMAVFAWQSLRGGLDICGRLLAPRLRIDPALVEVPLRLQDERARLLLALVVSLVPGALSVRLDAQRLTMHTLDQALPVLQDTRQMEQEVARLLGLALPEEHTP